MRPVANIVTVILQLFFLSRSIVTADSFVREDVALGDPTVSYGSTEFTPGFEYLVWGEFAADGSDDVVMWHCAMDPDSAEMIPWDGKGFRAFESTDWGRSNTPGRDAEGLYYAGLNRMGQLVLVRPTSGTTGTVEVLGAPADFSRRAVYGLDLPDGYPGLGFIFWISNTEGLPLGPGDPRISNVQLRFLRLSQSADQITLQDQARPPVQSGFGASRHRVSAQHSRNIADHVWSAHQWTRSDCGVRPRRGDSYAAPCHKR
ncbi:MAG: hypothetical protein HC888_14235 [Candidatus Competibacteraceae bacterium]|nr:hypothetical protein [Candidatus Competibacteraceae bacterium]